MTVQKQAPGSAEVRLTRAQADEIVMYLTGCCSLPHPSNISDLLDALRAAHQAPPETVSGEGPCTEADGCPVELAVLQRFWRAHQAPQAEPLTPPDKARFCRANGADGCADSWHVGGNYGSPVCRHPEHHAAHVAAVGAQPAKPGKPYHDPEFCELEHPGKPCPQSGSLKLTVPTHGMTPLYLATMFHEAYERLAPSFGYETRPDTRSFDPDSKNGRLMVATCAAILDRVRMPVAAVGAQAAEQGERHYVVPLEATPAMLDALDHAMPGQYKIGRAEAKRIWRAVVAAAPFHCIDTRPQPPLPQAEETSK